MEVRAGTYTGTSTTTPSASGAPGSPITFKADPGVVISGGPSAFAISSRSYITVTGFTITGTTSYGIFVNNSTGVVVSGNTVSGTASHGIYVAGGSGVTVSGNTVSGTSGTASYGIYTSNGSGVVVSGNTVSGTASYGIYALGGGTVTVSNNTVSSAGQPVSGSTGRRHLSQQCCRGRARLGQRDP